MSGKDLCILTPTFQGYRELADLTTRIIDRSWADHPPMFYCGVPGRVSEQWIELREDPMDWMGFVRSAVREVRRRGYRQGYLVLEEHPPVFRCNAEHLNRHLPELMARLHAAYIGLSGWGQGRPVTGSVLGREYFWVENVAPDFLWKFQLHPALWRLDALEEILDALVAELPLELRNPWAFERYAGRADARISEALKARAYRVCGERMTACRVRGHLLRLERFGAKAVRFVAGRVFGEGAWIRVDRLATFLFQYYEGPYPLFRAGIMDKSRLNRQLMRFLTLHGRRGLAREMADTVRAMRWQPMPSPSRSWGGDGRP